MGTTTGTGILGGNTAMVFDGTTQHRNFGNTVKIIHFTIIYKNIRYIEIFHILLEFTEIKLIFFYNRGKF